MTIFWILLPAKRNALMELIKTSLTLTAEELQRHLESVGGRPGIMYGSWFL